MNLPAEDELLGNLYVQNQMYEDAIKLFSALNKRDNSPQARANLAMAYAASGRTAEARRTLARAMAPNSAMSRRLGEIDAAFQWLERAYEKKDPMLGSLMVEPILDPIRSDPRYTELLRKADLIR